MNERNDRTEEIPTFQEENHTPEPDHKPEEPHRSVDWSHIAILLGIAAGIVIILLIAIISIRSNLNAADATASETPSATPKQTEETDFYTDDDTPSPSATTASDTKSDQKKKDRDDDDDSDDSDAEVPADLPLVKTFDNVNLNNGISITAKATSGTLEVVATDSDGKSTVIFKEDGPFDKSDVRTDLDSGTYTIAVYGNASGWSWSYNSY